MKSNYYLILRSDDMIIYDFEKNIILKPKSRELTQRIKKTFTKSTYLPDKIINNINLGLIIDNKTNKFNTYNYLTTIYSSTDKITLMITQDCNLRCKYCYGGKSGTYGESKKFMTYEVAKQSVDFLLSRSTTSKKFFLNFFGGEPLLNFNVIKKTVDYCNNLSKGKKISFNFSMTTNLTLLNKDIAVFLKKNNFGLTISLDGPAIINDKNRVFKNGKGTFYLVRKKIELLKEYKIPFILRGTITKENYINYENILNFLKSLNPYNTPQISIESLYDDNNLNNFPISDNINEYFKIVNSYNEKEFNKFFNRKIDRLPKNVKSSILKIHNLNKTQKGCGFLRGTTAVSTSGELYPCHRFVGMDGYAVGNIYTGENVSTIKHFCEALDNATKKCNNCFAKYICARACIRDIAKNGGIFIHFPDSYCKLIRKYTESILFYYFKLKTERKELFEKLLN